jgi:chromosome segregation ATPase
VLQALVGQFVFLKNNKHLLVFFSTLLKLGDITKKLTDIQTKLSSPEDLKRKQEDFIANLTKQQTPLIDEIKRLIPILDKLKQQKDSENLNRELEKSFQPITQKLNDLTQQKDLLKNIDSKLNHLSQNIDKENDLKKRLDTQRQLFLTKKNPDFLKTFFFSRYCERNFYSYSITTTSY